MNILFALYGDFTSNTANPLTLYARELQLRGHSCAIAVPSNLESVALYENPSFVPVLYRDVLQSPASVFPDGKPAEVVHACTPREIVRRFVTAYMSKRPTPLVIYLEDNEYWIAARTLGLEEEALLQHTEREISELLPESLAHPFRYDSFIGLADAVAVIQEKLRTKVPPWVPCATVLIGVDVEFFSPRSAELSLRRKYGVIEGEKVIVYHGGLNEFVRPAITTLCTAVGLIKQQGYPCRLLRTGPAPLDFLEELPRDTASAIHDLGVIPRRELPDLLALADVFVQPGKIDAFEDLRLAGKVPEFLAMGRPVVMPNANIAHLFTDGVDAVLLSTGTAEEIADKCVAIFANSERASSIGRAGRLLAETYFDVRSQARILDTIYHDACDSFDPAIASEIWAHADTDTSSRLLLARKLELLAGSPAKPDCSTRDLLREYGRFLRIVHRRLNGLEEALGWRDSALSIAQLNLLKQELTKRDRQIAELQKTIGEFCHSKSWRLTLPLRKAASLIQRTRQRINSA
jgi:glycosyltransferase involved in cell wall biosynthesis